MSNDTGVATVQFECEHCKAVLTVPRSQAGTQIPCSGCGQTLTVPVPAAPPTPPEPVVVGDAALAAASVEQAAPAAAAVSASIAPDPTASKEFQAQTSAPPSPPPYAAPVYKPAPKPPAGLPAGRRGVLALSLVLVVGIGAGVGVKVSRDTQRARVQANVDSLLTQAQTAYASEDVPGAATFAQKAQKEIAQSPLELDAAARQRWKGLIENYAASAQKFAEIQQVAESAEKDPAGARSQLENKRQLLDSSEHSRPLLDKIDAVLAEIGRIEEKQKLERLRTELLQADALYTGGKIEDAAQKAVDIGRLLGAKPKVRDRDLESRLEVLAKRAEQLKEAKDIRLTARKDFDAARTKLDSKLNGLDEKNLDLKPLIARLAQLRHEIQQEEWRSHKLGKQETAQLENLAHAFGRFDPNLVVKSVEGDTIGLEDGGKALRLGFKRTLQGPAPFFESSGVRMLLDLKALTPRSLHPLRLIKQAVALGEAMKKAGVASDDMWDVSEEAPFVSARRTGNDGLEYIFLGDKLYAGKPVQKTLTEKDADEQFQTAGGALEKAVLADTDASEEVRAIVAEAVKASYKEAEWYDHLPGEFVRRVLNDRYIVQNIPNAAVRLKNELAGWQAAYTRINQPHLSFSGVAPDGGQLAELLTYEDHAIWRVYDKAHDTTTFAIKNPDDERDYLFILYDFPGQPKEFPENLTPKTVRMTHEAVGVTATYDPATQKMTFDKNKWDLAVALESPPIPPEVVAAKGFGPTTWCLPPHVLLVDEMGNTKSIVTPYGKLDMQDFSKIAEAAQRKAAMDAFLDQMAKVLPTANYLHLYFRYFHEYILDSPITSKPELLGSRSHAGDIHQTVYQSLARLHGGRYIGDCDDLAELFMNVTRRQGKLSYVMALPSHAACGWAEKQPGPEGEYTFYIVDTGPPRMFVDASLDKAIESACRAYDDDKTMRFDPKSLGFLFRFNGEPTRTPYWLSSRMYIDRAYGETMERVQSYWHFHFYALGIKTMSEMIEKGDRVPENCIELAGLYGQVREVQDSIKWTNEALKQFHDEDRLSRYSEEFRIGMLWHDEKHKQKSFEAVKPMCAELKQLEHDPQRFNYTSTRLDVMSLLEVDDRPWEAWDVVRNDITLFAEKRCLKIEHVAGLVNVYQKMQKLISAGKQPTIEETASMKQLEGVLKWFFEAAIFSDPEDDFTGILRRYASLADWYSGQFGEQRLVSELLKDGPYPDKPRDHRNRKNPEAEDWKWIRLSVPAYAVAIGDALNFDDPPEKWRKDDVIKLTDAMERAAEHARKFGSLAGLEDIVLASRVTRAFLKKDWADLEKVLQETQARDWARLTSSIAETFGRCARFVTPEEFVAQYRLFTKYIKVRTAYFTVIYEAYRADAIGHALAASKVALEENPGNADMAREAEYLAQLAKKKLAAEAAKKK